MSAARLLRAVRQVLLCAGSCVAAFSPAIAADAEQARVSIAFAGRADAPDLVCPARSPRSAGSRPAPAAPMEVPEEDEVRDALAAATAAPGTPGADRAAPACAGTPGRLRVAIWGDSHVAAGFVTEELVRAVKVAPDEARPLFLPASFQRPGVRLPVRKSCITPGWRFESAHSSGAAAQRPGPGLVNMVSDTVDAWLAVDLRGQGGGPGPARLQLLVAQAQPGTRLGLSVDGGPEVLQPLGGAASTIDIASDRPVSTLKLRLAEGSVVLAGLRQDFGAEAPIRFDVFGLPGATAAGWRAVDLAALRAWFPPDAYDVVALAYGTNEGNDAHFNAQEYRGMLAAALRNLRLAFPGAACLLMGPGDRGVLVPRRAKAKATRNAKAQKTRAAPRQDLLRFTRVHEEINAIQKSVAAEAGCQVWNAMDAMGGRGGAYAWARKSPALMAGDLTHFTITGYQQLAQDLAASQGWGARGAYRGTAK